MRWTTWLLLLLALAATAGAWHLLGGAAEREPRDLVLSAKERLAGEEPDTTGARREFDLAVQLAERRGDPRLLAEVLLERAAFLETRASFREARSDVERALQLGAEPASEVHLRLAVLGMHAGEHERALEFADRTLADAPFHSGAHAVRGLVRLEMGEEALTRLHAVAEEELPGEYALRARELADRAATRDPDDAARASLLLELERLLPQRSGNSLDAVRREVELATQAFADARASFGQSLLSEVRADVVHHLMDLDVRADRPADAVDLGLAARPHPSVAADVRALQRLAAALDATGRSRTGSLVLERAIQGGQLVTAEFLPTWCRILYEAEAWPLLHFVAADLRNRSPDVPGLREQRATAEFFAGAAATHVGRRPMAHNALGRFVSGAVVEPVPDARALAWKWLADLERTRDDPAAERRALEQSTRLGPDLSGESWLRLCELAEAAGAPPEAPLDQLTNAMRLLPAITDEQLDRWKRLGERVLADQTRDVGRAFEELVRLQRYVPSDEVSCYELWRYAELHREAGNWFGVAAACRELLDGYPRFLPAFDLLIRAHAETGKTTERADLLLERLEHVASSEEALADLRALHEAAELAPRQVLALMRLDPRHTGVLAIAADLLEAGQPSVALRGLQLAQIETLGDAGLLLAAECQHALGDPRAAITLLGGVEPASPSYTRALTESVRAALAIGDLELLDRLVGGARDAEELDKAEVLELVDELVVQREWHPAWTLLHELDGRVGLRGGDVTLRVAAAAIVAGEHSAAREALDRSAAFRSDGATELGRLVLAADQGRWATLPSLARDLLDSAFEPSPLCEVLLVALEERHDEAVALATEHADALAADPRWALAELALAAARGETPEPRATLGESAADETIAFLRGEEEARRDPRLALVQLAALERAEWTLWALAELADAPPSAGRLWPLYLSAVGEHALGHRLAFRKHLLPLTESFPGFAPGWVLLTRAEEERLERHDHPELLLLRARRRAALGGAVLYTDAELLLGHAVVLTAQGDVAGARVVAARAVEVAPDDLAARLALANLAAQDGDYSASLGEYLAFFDRAEPGTAFDLVPEFLDRLRAGEREQQFDVHAVAAALDRVAARLPADPALALARARLQPRLETEAPVFAIGRAWSILEDFRDETDDAPLAFLRAGSTADWLSFIARYDLERADAFVEGELALNPTSIEMWLVRGRLLEARGAREEALAHYERLAAMAPDPRAVLRIAAVLAESGGDVVRVDRELERVRALERRSADDPEILFLRGRARALAEPPQLDAALGFYARLWERRTPDWKAPTEAQLGRAYGAALLQRGLAADRALAEQVLSTAATATTDLTERRLLERLTHLARHMPVVPQPPAAPPAPVAPVAPEGASSGTTSSG